MPVGTSLARCLQARRTNRKGAPHHRRAFRTGQPAAMYGQRLCEERKGRGTVKRSATIATAYRWLTRTRDLIQSYRTIVRKHIASRAALAMLRVREVGTLQCVTESIAQREAERGKPLAKAASSLPRFVVNCGKWLATGETSRRR